MFLRNENVVTDRLNRKLDYKRLSPFEIIAKAKSLYKLNLPDFIYIYLIVYIDRLIPASSDLLLK